MMIVAALLLQMVALPIDGNFLTLPPGYIGETCTAGRYVGDWWVGPGVDGCVQISTIPDSERQILNLDWQRPGKFPGVDPLAEGRETVLEYHLMGWVRPLDAATLDMTFWIYSGRGPITIVPLVWVNYRDGHYFLMPCRPTALGGQIWTLVACQTQLPSVGGRGVDPATNYVGFGIDLPEDQGAIHLLVTDVSVTAHVRPE